MVEDAARDNLRYLEVRYCPELSRRQGLTLGQVIEAELRGLARGERDFRSDGGGCRPGQPALSRSSLLPRAEPAAGADAGPGDRSRAARACPGRARLPIGWWRMPPGTTCAISKFATAPS